MSLVSFDWNRILQSPFASLILPEMYQKLKARDVT